MLRCRPTRIVLKQEDMQEYEAKRNEWVAEKVASEGKPARSNTNAGDKTSAADLVDAVQRQTRQSRRDRLGVTGN